MTKVREKSWERPLCKPLERFALTRQKIATVTSTKSSYPKFRVMSDNFIFPSC
jgi:hypothetical protein